MQDIDNMFQEVFIDRAKSVFGTTKRKQKAVSLILGDELGIGWTVIRAWYTGRTAIPESKFGLVKRLHERIK